MAFAALAWFGPIAYSDSDLVATGQSRYPTIANLVNDAIQSGQTPGAVVVVASSEQILYAQSFGDRQVLPHTEPMTLETVFDLASITKPLATGTSIMTLVDAGKIDVGQPVARYLPEFGQHGKESITVAELLLHTSGLIPDNPLSDYQQGAALAWQQICDLKLRAPPGTKFAYSDVGFIVLGKLVQQVSGKPLDAFARETIFEPLGMRETTYNPVPKLRVRAAATQQRDGDWIKGVVHDPRAHLLDGVAGHAGVFSTAADLVRYGRVMLSRGSDANTKLFSPSTYEQMIQPRDVLRGTRTYSWDHRSPYSSNRGTSFSDAAFGHGGFTGTVLWIDPDKDLVFIFLSTRLHPDGKGNVNTLAGKIASVVGETK
ncbi:MAG: beta-lactamase family protein [Pirellulaceae bacterium]|nr:beta-lactamase family protein [Pirellulaceae bacterium]